MMSGLVKAYGQANDMWKSLVSGKFTMRQKRNWQSSIKIC